MDYPKKKQEMVEYVRQSKQGEEVLSLFEKLPDREYQNMADVEKSLREAA